MGSLCLMKHFIVGERNLNWHNINIEYAVTQRQPMTAEVKTKILNKKSYGNIIEKNSRNRGFYMSAQL